MIKRNKVKHIMATPSQRRRSRLPNYYCGDKLRHDYKTDAWVENMNYMPPKAQKDNGIWGPVGRGYYHKAPGNHYCTNCDTLFAEPREASWVKRRRTEGCGKCGSHAVVGISSSIRVPRKTANARAWKNFRIMFIDPYVAYQVSRNPRWPESPFTDEEYEAMAVAREAADKEENNKIND